MESSPLKVIFGLMELYYGKCTAMDCNLIMGKNLTLTFSQRSSESSQYKQRLFACISKIISHAICI